MRAVQPDAAYDVVYLDPPYYVKGSQLYLSFYDEADHAALAKALRNERRFKWVLSYDNAPEVRASTIRKSFPRPWNFSKRRGDTL